MSEDGIEVNLVATVSEESLQTVKDDLYDTFSDIGGDTTITVESLQKVEAGEGFIALTSAVNQVASLVNELKDTLKSMKPNANNGTPVGGGPGTGGTGGSDKSFFQKVREAFFVQDDDDDRTAKAKRSKQLEIASSAANKIADTGLSMVKQSFGVLESIYEKLKSASPLLQTIESLFNLAVTLFLMPLGNKLAEEILPAMLDLVDAVVDMWDNMEDMTLSEMIAYMMEVGVSAFSELFYSIGDTLEEQGGTLGRIGELMNTIGDFIANGTLTNLISAGTTVATQVVSHIKEFLTLFIAFKALWAALKIIEIASNASIWNPTGWGLVGVAATTLAASSAVGYGVLSATGLAEGGYVPATDGGEVHILGEGGEGEYVIPESKMNSVGGVTNNFYISGLTYDDLVDTIDDRVSRSISRSKIQGAF